MRIKQAVKQGLQIRKVERFYAVVPNGQSFELYPEAQLFYGVAWRKMPKKRKRTKATDGSGNG